MDLDGAKQDTGWRPGVEPNPWPQFMPFGQLSAYGYSSLPRHLLPGEQVSFAANHENVGSVKNRVTQLLTNSAPVPLLYPDRLLDSRIHEGPQPSLQRSMSFSQNSESGVRAGVPFQHNSSMFSPGERNVSYGLPPDLPHSMFMSNTNTETSIGVMSVAAPKLKDKPKLKIVSSSANVKTTDANTYDGNLQLKTTAIDFSKKLIDQKSYLGKMAETSAMFVSAHGSPAYRPISDLPQNKLLNFDKSDPFSKEIKSFAEGKSNLSESINSDLSIPTIGRSQSQGDLQQRPTVFHNADLHHGSDSKSLFQYSRTYSDSQQHMVGSQSNTSFQVTRNSNNSEPHQAGSQSKTSFRSPDTNVTSKQPLVINESKVFFNPVTITNNSRQSLASSQSKSFFQPAGTLIENSQPARPASRSWSPWDNMIHSTNSSPGTVQSTTSLSQPPSPVINNSPVPSPYSSSSSSHGSLSVGVTSASSFGSAAPGTKSPSLGPSEEQRCFPNLQQSQSKDPFIFQNEGNEMKPPESLPKSSKPSKKKSNGKLKESRRRRGVPFPDVSLDEINPELARMIRESKIKDEMKSRKRDQQNPLQNSEKKSKPVSVPPKPNTPFPPINNASFLNQQINSVIKSTSPYEFSDESDVFSPAILSKAYNATINVNSKMYSMNEMLAMTNSRSDTVDTKSEPVTNGEVKKKKKKKKTVEKMLSSSNMLENPYHVFPNPNSVFNDKESSIKLNNSVQNSALNVHCSENNHEPDRIKTSSNFPSGSIAGPNEVTSSNTVHNVLNTSISAHFINNISPAIQSERQMDTTRPLSVGQSLPDTFAVQTENSEKIDENHLFMSINNPCHNRLKQQSSPLDSGEKVVLNSKLCCTDCKSHGAIFSPHCQSHGESATSINDTNQMNKVKPNVAADDNTTKTLPPNSIKSANTYHDSDGNYPNVLSGIPQEMYHPNNIKSTKFSMSVIKSENCEMDFEQYLSGCQEPNTEGALLNNLEASIHSLFTKTFNHDNSMKSNHQNQEPLGTLKRSSSWHDIHDKSSTCKPVGNKLAKKNPLIDMNMDRPFKAPKTKKVKIQGTNGFVKPAAVRIGPPLSPEEERLNRLRHNQQEIASCKCLGEDLACINEAVEGPYYTQLGSGKNIQSIREMFEKQTGVTGDALRIEKVIFTGKEGKSSQGCPIAKWIIRRAGPQEKYLCVVRQRRGHFCDKAFIVINVVAWEGVPSNTADDLYSHLISSLTKNGYETERRCGTNEKKTCACQGIDLVRRGASFSFGCSWSMYFNGCKYARSRDVRKFKLKDTSREEELENRLQSLATVVGPLYEKVAPSAHSNQCEFKDGMECRLGANEKKPFSGVTACVDFCAHAHKDVHNMNNGSTVVVTLTKQRGFSEPDDEQLHVLPLYILDSTDEYGSSNNQMEKVQKGALEILQNFPHEARMRSQPLTPKKKGRNAKKDQSPNAKREAAMHSILVMKAKQRINPLNSKFSMQNKQSFNKTETKIEYTPALTSESKENMTFDNLMSLADTPGFSEMYDSFWNFFYSNGTFPPSNFLEQWGAKLPSNHLKHIKQDVNNQSKTIIQKPSSEILPGISAMDIIHSSDQPQQPSTKNNQVFFANMGKDSKDPSSCNLQNQMSCDLTSNLKYDFQGQQPNNIPRAHEQQMSENMFKVPSTPDVNNAKLYGHLNVSMGNDINNPFRSPESTNSQQKEFMQKSSQHPINTLAQSENLPQILTSSAYYSGQDPSIHPFRTGQAQLNIPPFSPQKCPSSFQNPTPPTTSVHPLINNSKDLQYTNSIDNVHGIYSNQMTLQEKQVFKNNSVTSEEWPQAKGQCLLNNPMDLSNLEANRKTPQQRPNGFVHNQNSFNSGANIPSNFQNSSSGAINNLVPQSQNCFNEQQNLPFNHDSVFRDSRYKLYNNNNQGLSQNDLTAGQQSNRLGSYSSLTSPSIKQPLFESPLHMLSEAASHTTSSLNHPENRATPSIPHFNNSLCGQVNHGSFLSQEQQHHPSISMQNVPQTLPLNTNNAHSIDNGKRNLLTHQHHMPSMPNVSENNFQKNLLFGVDGRMSSTSLGNFPAFCGDAKIPNAGNGNLQKTRVLGVNDKVPISGNENFQNIHAFGSNDKVPISGNGSFHNISAFGNNTALPNAVSGSNQTMDSNIHIPNMTAGSIGNNPVYGSDVKHESTSTNPEEPCESILDPTVVHCQMEYNEENFHDQEVGGVAIALSHGAVLFEVAKRELHATTALKNPNRYHPTRISLVFYQHKNLNYANHGFAEYEQKEKRLRQEKLEKRKESMENSDIIPPELKMKKKKKDKDEIDFATTSAAQYKYMWDAPVSHSSALTTDSIITRWIDPQPMVTGPYQRWVLPSC